MIFGRIDIDLHGRAIHTHRDSYLLDTVSVVSVRRPILAGGIVSVFGLSGFGVAFNDLLFPAEIAAVLAIGITAFSVGICVGQLQLLSRDLRGSELSGAVWGSYGALNSKRIAIARAICASGNKAPDVIATPTRLNAVSGRPS